MSNRIKLNGTSANTFQIGLRGAGLSSAEVTTPYTLKLPAQLGTDGQFIRTDANGNLSFANVATNKIENGNSNVTVFANANITVSSNGQANIVTVSSNGTHAQTTIQNDVTVTGNLSIAGNLSYTDVTTLSITDPVISLGTGPNGSALVTDDGLDRGTALHTFGAGAVYTSAEQTPSGNTSIKLTSIAGIFVGMEVSHNNVIAQGTRVIAIDVANTAIQLSEPTTALLANNSSITVGLDIIRFIGWDVSDNEFVIASDVSIVNNIVTYNALGNVRMGDVIVDKITIQGQIPPANVNSIITSDTTGNIVYSTLDRGIY